MAVSNKGDWVISGGFETTPNETQHIPIQSVEVINNRIQKSEVDLSMPLAQHCMVHVHCFYYMYAGGTGGLSNIAKPSAYYHHLKSGHYHELQNMKYPRANHVCFTHARTGQSKKVSLFQYIKN